MGLDTYASREDDHVTLTREDRAVFQDLDLRLCEWIGDGSFRGQVYLDVVDAVADVYLTTAWIPPEDVAGMAEAFEACNPEEVSQAAQEDRFPSTPDEVRSLRTLFRVCADRGLGLIGSW
jgi:hypothetical protein